MDQVVQKGHQMSDARKDYLRHFRFLQNMISIRQLNDNAQFLAIWWVEL